MSYILDALRRADQDRTRREVPGLDDQGIPLGDDEAVRRRGIGRIGRRQALLGGAALVLLLAVAAWWALAPQRTAEPPKLLGRAEPTAAAPAAMPAPPGAPAAPRTAPQAVAVPVEPVPAAAPPAVARAQAPVPVPEASSPVVTAAPRPQRAESQRVATNVTSAPAASAAPASAAAVGAAPVATPGATASRPARSPETRPVPLAQLTPQQRAELPPITIGGAIYSESAASRFVLINGEVVREGETAASGIVLERIEPKAATLRWRSLRFEVPL